MMMLDWDPPPEARPGTCPVCLNAHGATAKILGSSDSRVYCTVCGEYLLPQEAGEDYLHSGNAWWTPLRRAALSHLLRTRRNIPLHGRSSRPILRSELLEAFKQHGIELPTPAQQADNVLRYVGDHERETGEEVFQTGPEFYAVVGAPNPDAAARLTVNLADEGIIHAHPEELIGQPLEVTNLSLTLAGWRRWEDLRRGLSSSKDGFIAMQFGDARLDNLVREVIQRGIREKLGLEVHRMDSPGKARAGVIDNNMREAIEEAAFVLVEVSHGNHGAYWEAGLAEGLRKPVIYLCEQAVWDNPDTRPHFDVNHRTTVMWDEAKPDEFIASLAATIQNSLRKR